MNAKHLLTLGVPYGAPVKEALGFISAYCTAGGDKQRLREEITAVLADPDSHVDDELRASFARSLIAERERPPLTREHGPAPWRQWGQDLDENCVGQMKSACLLPVSVRGALMPDAHLGYGLPIGGVLATDNSVIPYAVGVDIACRMCLTVIDWPVEELDRRRDDLRDSLQRETLFGVGARFKRPREHDVLDDDWDVSPVTRRMKDRARVQLGTSGSGNHFVEFGVLTIDDHADLPLPAGRWLALLSHSGSRGTGAAVCDHYSKLARKLRHDLPQELSRLAWLSLDEPEGREYWDAMNLMGRYAQANHECIHRHVVAALGAESLWQVQNHHNFAWLEEHDGRQLVVHRKGATPAGEGVLGIIPGSMASPGYLVRGRGSAASLASAAHGAGRAMSRTQANKTLNWSDANQLLRDRGVELMSAGLDEVPFVYKDIHTVMGAMTDLVEPLARFDPRLVRMCKAGERPED